LLGLRNLLGARGLGRLFRFGARLREEKRINSRLLELRDDGVGRCRVDGRGFGLPLADKLFDRAVDLSAWAERSAPRVSEGAGLLYWTQAVLADPVDVVGIVAQLHRDRARDVLGGRVSPLGITRTVIDIAHREDVELPEAVQMLKAIPIELAEAPYRNVIWDPIRHTMIPSGKSLARGLIRFMVGLPEDEQKLLESYKIAQGVDPNDGRIKLPKKVS
jgi:hypothetical protein